MSLKMLQGHSQDINFDPHLMERWTRDNVSMTFVNYKLEELKRWVFFWTLLAVSLVFAAFAVFDTIFVIPAAAIFFYAVPKHFNYLKAWSKWNKFSRKTVVRMDLEKEPRIIAPPKMPWTPLPRG